MDHTFSASTFIARRVTCHNFFSDVVGLLLDHVHGGTYVGLFGTHCGYLFQCSRGVSFTPSPGLSGKCPGIGFFGLCGLVSLSLLDSRPHCRKSRCLISPSPFSLLHLTGSSRLRFFLLCSRQLRLPPLVGYMYTHSWVLSWAITFTVDSSLSPVHSGWTSKPCHYSEPVSLPPSGATMFNHSQPTRQWCTTPVARVHYGLQLSWTCQWNFWSFAWLFRSLSSLSTSAVP